MNNSTAFVLGFIILGLIVRFALLKRLKRKNGTIDVRRDLKAVNRSWHIVTVAVIVALLALALFNIIRNGHPHP